MSKDIRLDAQTIYQRLSPRDKQRYTTILTDFLSHPEPIRSYLFEDLLSIYFSALEDLADMSVSRNFWRDEYCRVCQSPPIVASDHHPNQENSP